MSDEPVRPGPRGGKWLTWHMNKSFIADLELKYGTEEFTTEEAYDLYFRTRKLWEGDDVDHYWMEMNIRNHLYSANAHGLLEIVRPGVFRFERRLQ